tara:strand:- start:929 stop:1177 length:249 start_codon:yes stop_codon:yes gene_type:complete
MEKYNKFLRNITELLEKGLYNSNDIKREMGESIKFKAENLAKKLNLVSREEFEVQKKILEKVQKELLKIKNKKKKIKKARKS